MFGVRPLSYLILALGLGGACTVTVAPIRSGPDAKDASGPDVKDVSGPDAKDASGPDAKGGTDGVPSNEVAPKCTGTGGGDTDAGISLSAGLLAYYPCEQAVETALPDLSVNNRNAQLASSATGDAGFRFVNGKVGKALSLNSAYNAHVVLPPGMLADACEATVASWVYLNTQKNWQRVWTFSTGGNAYMYLTTNRNGSGLIRGGITLKNNPGDEAESIESPSVMPAGVWTHLAVVLGPAGMALYVDGALVDSNPESSLRPADMGKTLYDYIGRSNYSWDAYLDGNIDEFRVYNRALSPAEIRALVNP
jgi:hypothetical protein